MSVHNILIVVFYFIVRVCFIKCNEKTKPVINVLGKYALVGVQRDETNGFEPYTTYSRQFVKFYLFI